MKTSLLDTNVLLRFLVGDNVAQQKQAEQWFTEAESGQRTIMVTSIVVAETIFVLESFYKQSREHIAAALRVFLSQRWLDVEARDELLDSLSHYEAGLHFVDSFLLSWAKLNSLDLLSFDKRLHKKVK